jgi:hypothetical protein
VSNNERNVVLIDDVSPSTQSVQVTDMRGGKFAIPYGGTRGSVLIPKKGESWIVSRNDFSWSLIDRYETSEDRVKITDLQPGDNRVTSTATLHLSTPSVAINNQPFGITTWERFDIPQQGLWSITLAQSPISIKSIMAFNNSRLVDPSYLRLNENILDGSPKIKFAPGVLIIYYQYNP